MTLKFMGKKRGMLQMFDDNGEAIACTVIEAEPNVVTQKKSVETDGYCAIQLGFETIQGKDPRTLERRTKKPRLGHFKKNNISPKRHLVESRLDTCEGYEVGQEISVEHFSEIGFVDVTATSKGKGFQGVMKVHNFKGGPAAHGSKFHRSGGSTGMRSTPGRCFKGGKLPRQMGNKTVTVQNLRVVKVIPEENLIVVEGAVPGYDLVYISEANKRPTQSKKSSS